MRCLRTKTENNPPKRSTKMIQCTEVYGVRFTFSFLLFVFSSLYCINFVARLTQYLSFVRRQSTRSVFNEIYFEVSKNGTQETITTRKTFLLFIVFFYLYRMHLTTRDVSSPKETRFCFWGRFARGQQRREETVIPDGNWLRTSERL